MNIFQTHVARASYEVDENVTDIDGIVQLDQEVVGGVDSTALDVESNNVDEALQTQASLESLYDSLSGFVKAGYSFTPTHAQLLKQNLIILAGGDISIVGKLTPSLENDVVVDNNTLVASMEGVGEAIKAGAKAAWDAIVIWFKKAWAWIDNFVSKIKSKIKNRINTTKETLANLKANVKSKNPAKMKDAAKAAQAEGGVTVETKFAGGGD